MLIASPDFTAGNCAAAAMILTPIGRIRDMVTLRTYPNPVDASLAKTRLDDRNIPCSLEDESVNAWGGADLYRSD